MACSPEAAVDGGFAAKEGQPLWKLGALWLGMTNSPRPPPPQEPRRTGRQ